jgi:hypothetical protein
MQVVPEFLFAAAIAAVAFLCGIFYLRARSRRTRSVGRRVSRGPANLRFTCAGCSNQFTHSRRTQAAWENGTRKFFCHACHTKSRGAQAAAGPSASIPSAARRPRWRPGWWR